MNKIQKVIKIGDFVYSSANGEPMEIIKISRLGFYTKKRFFSYGEHGKLYWLTKHGYLTRKKSIN